MMDKSVTETYMGEWKNDKRSGFGIAERSDGLKYEGEWFNNKKYGYGVTTFKDGSKEEGKYKNNVLITSQKKKHLFLIRSAKFRERIDAAVYAAQRASKLALQKADIAISRTATARGEAELADAAAVAAQQESDIALAIAKQFAPDFQQPTIHKSKAPFFHLKSNEDITNGRNNSFYQKTTDSKEVSSPDPSFIPQQSTAQISQATSSQTGPQTITSGEEKVTSNQVTTDSTRTSSVNVRTDSTTARAVNLRRNSQVSGDPPSFSFQQAMSDHFDHYKRPPSRDTSVDRTNKIVGRPSIGSRQPSVDKSNPLDGERVARAPSLARSPTPQMTTGNGAATGAGVTTPSYVPPVNEAVARRRTPVPDSQAAAQPKRTESLFINSTATKSGTNKGVS